MAASPSPVESHHACGLAACVRRCVLQAGGVHVIQTFFSRGASEEIQIQGRTARQGKSGTYSLILDVAEIQELGLDAAALQTMQAPACYQELSCCRDDMQAELSIQLEKKLQDANAWDAQSHDYFDALLQGYSSFATKKLLGLHTALTTANGRAAYHVVCCYDESSSMGDIKWQQLQEAHETCMKTLQRVFPMTVSIIQFGSSARTVLDRSTPAEALACTLHWNSGSTNFEPALAMASQQIRHGDRGVTPVLLFMSDGANHDGDCIRTIQAMQQEFPALVFHAIIFGKPDSARLRGMVGAAKAGHFHVSADGVQLVQTFSAIARSLEYTGRKSG